MVEESTPNIPVGEFDSVSQLIVSSSELQLSLAILFVGLVAIGALYRKFSKWVKSKRFSYTRPHLSRFVRTLLLPVFAIALISTINVYVQASDILPAESSETLSAAETFAKILNTINMLVIGYTIAQLVPLIIDKYQKAEELRDDYEIWKDRRGFSDDKGDLFHKLYEWIPPKNTPEGMKKEEFEENLKTEEGRKSLEEFVTPKGYLIGTILPTVSHPYDEWKKAENEKYNEYLEACMSGNNDSGRKLLLGVKPQEVFPLDVWREERRLNDYQVVRPGAKPPGYAKKRRETMPKSLNQIIPTIIFAVAVVGVISWWGVDLFVLGTAIAGLGVGVGFALKETMENFFAYFMIRKDNIFAEGDRVEIDNYNGYIHKITTRVTYIRHGLNESIAIFPTRQLVTAKVINFSKENQFIPAIMKVGVSYLHDPKEVASVLNKCGRRAMRELIDLNGKHLAVQVKCPYLDQNKPSCGCDKGIVDLQQPWVLFVDFNDSALDFQLWVYVRDYGSQFEVKSKMRMIVYEEFKKYDIRIPWPIRTIYQGDAKKENEDLSLSSKERTKVYKEFGPGEMNEY